MFLAMLLSTLSGLMALLKHPLYKKYSVLTLVSLGVGGMILGPVVQRFAFGEFWTGVPIGWDLTDNKTLIAFIFWIIAVLVNRKRRNLYTPLLLRLFYLSSSPSLTACLVQSLIMHQAK